MLSVLSEDKMKINSEKILKSNTSAFTENNI
jgi:hypothetical protein